MASFTLNFSKQYRDNGNEQGTTTLTSTRTVTDSEANGTFETGDILSGAFAGTATLNYRGSFTVTDSGGNTYTLFVAQNGNNGAKFVFGNITNLTTTQIEALLPNTLPTLNTGAFTVCFAAGTLIATPDGERAVETLVIGDMVLTADGRSEPVRWMGRQTKHKSITPDREFAPVRVTAGALGTNVPHTDLILTADHALIVDGLAVNASALVNGTTIRWEAMDALPDQITYWHVETEAHDEILANGAPAETFVDYIGRKAFDNHQEYLDLYGAERIIPEMRRPRVSARRQLPAATAARFGIGSFGDAVDGEFAVMMDHLNVA